MKKIHGIYHQRKLCEICHCDSDENINCFPEIISRFLRIFNAQLIQQETLIQAILQAYR